jgi:beta-barrel assembly-enhancing protease
MGVTRGIMTELESEAELAALLGHEMGHVNARHAAQRQGQAMLAQAAVAGLAVATADTQWGGLAAIGGQVGASALLSSYSRENEREADALGQDYMVKAGYPASGMTQLHGLLVREAKERPRCWRRCSPRTR